MSQKANERFSKASEQETIKLLRNSLEYCLKNTPFYQQYLKIREIKDLEQFQTLPYTTKDHVTKSFPYGMLASPLSEIIAYYESSGTTSLVSMPNKSSRSPSFLTQKDLDRDIARRLLNEIRVTKNDIVLNGLPYAYTSCGLAFHLAYQQQGAMVIACNNTSTLDNFYKQNNLASFLKPTILLSPYPFIYRALDADNNNYSEVSSIVLCGMSTSKNAKEKLSSLFHNTKICDVYGLSEFGAVTMACSHGNKHIIETDFYVETIDPVSEKNTNRGEQGELVITTLNREGSPKIRYRTGDWGKIVSDTPCSCGCPWTTLEIHGRITDRLLVRHKNSLLPIEFEDIICSFPETNGIYNIKAVKNDHYYQDFFVQCEIHDLHEKTNIEDLMSKQFFDRFSINVTVECLEKQAIASKILLSTPLQSLKKLKNFNTIK